jgi:hypothetical protein
MDFSNLTNDNILLYAMKNYDNPACHGIHEFNEDFDRIKYVKRLFKRYQTKGVLKERLILNHIIVVYNVFGPEAATRILFFRLEDDLWSILKTFLIFLNFLPTCADPQSPLLKQSDIVYGLDGKDVQTVEITVDMKLAERLRSI